MATMLGIILTFVPALAQPSKRPNILYIVADDMRQDTIAALGNPVIETPALDGLVRKGTVLSQANCAYPVCVPSRTEMLTGRIFASAIDPHKNQPPTLAERLREAGYETWHVGKWHIAGKPVTRGFVESRGLFMRSAVNPTPPLTYDRHGRPITGYRGCVFQDDDGNEFPELGVGLTPNISERFAEAAIELLRRKTEKPFFLHLNFTSPHDPRLVPAGYENRYPPGSVPLPENFQATPAINLKTRDEMLLPRPLDRADMEEELAVYYAQITHMDAQIGRVLEALRASGRERETIIVFVSDHGLALGSHGLLGKQNLYDHTLLVPCILAGPGISSGATAKAQVYLRDVSATLLDLCGLTIPQGWDAVSFKSLLSGETTEVHPYLVGYYLDESRSIRTSEWKLITFPRSGLTQLFNLGDDPLEAHNLAGDPAYAGIVENLRGKLREWSSTHALPGQAVK
ncbi:MAG: sulfatase-like hydrolase/transferase [Opitutaceae bacterium]|nr:sulfatase-like hydrolase/transferase [Opitutaceae bacterium]